MNSSTELRLLDDLKDMANILRIHTIEMTETANSGHPTTCSSIAEIMSVLFFHPEGMHYDPKDPRYFANDRLVLSKGHAAPILYAAWAHAGFIQREELLNIRKHTSDLEGHPTPRLPFVDVATGSLGQGLGVACGMAYSSKYVDRLDNVYFTILGDAECSEGSVWEALSFASHYKLNNMIAFIDVNRFGQGTESILKHDVQVHAQRFEAFGWETTIIDGHSVEDIVEALKKGRASKEKPFMIIAKTLKGKNFMPGIEDDIKWHGKVLGSKADLTIKSLQAVIKNPEVKLIPRLPSKISSEQEILIKQQGPISIGKIAYKAGSEVATRVGVGNALKKLGTQSTEVFVLDCDIKNSTNTAFFAEQHPEQFIECFIAEQNMISVAMGLSARGKVTFSNTFGAFLSRAYDQIRMAGISRSNIKLHGSHAGVSVGEDGPSQMGLEDIALYRPIPGMHILYPSDGVSAERAVEIAANTNGLFYIRTTRPNMPVLYDNEESFEIGKSKVLRQSENDDILIVAGGITLHEALKAYDLLKQENINVRILDIFSIKPLDLSGILQNASESNSTVLTVEDHYIHGGIKDSISSCLGEFEKITVHGIGVNEIPKSGKAKDLLEIHGIDYKAIIKKVKEIIQSQD
jgi:transketolase